jgi:hypothetical protein
MSDFNTLLQHVKDEVDKLWKEEPDELKVLRLGLLKNEAGSFGQYWTTWDFANGMIRDFSMYTMYPLLRAAHSDEVSLPALKALIEYFHPPYTVYLRYSGYQTMHDIDDQFRKVLPSIESKEQFIEFYTEFLRYTNKLAAWSYHYFTWEVGSLYPQRKAEDVAEMQALLASAP